MTATTRLPLRTKILFSLVMTVLFLGIAEAGFRMAGYGKKVLNARDAELGWRLIPGQDRLCNNGAKVHVNAHGMRDEEFPAEKPKGEFRVLVLGDSVTFGVDVEQDETFCRRLQLELRRRCPDRSIRIMNAGVHGYDLNQYFAYLRRKAPAVSPDLVLIALFQNDIEISAFPDPMWEFPGRDLLRKTAVFEFFEAKRLNVIRHIQPLRGLADREELFRRYVGTQSGDFADPQYAQQVTVGRGLLVDMAKHCQQQVWKLAVALVPNFANTEAPERNGLSKNFAQHLQALDVPHLDLLPALAPSHPTCWLPHDKGHLSADGHATVAKALDTWLQFKKLVPDCP